VKSLNSFFLLMFDLFHAMERIVHYNIYFASQLLCVRAGEQDEPHRRSVCEDHTEVFKTNAIDSKLARGNIRYTVPHYT